MGQVRIVQRGGWRTAILPLIISLDEDRIGRSCLWTQIQKQNCHKDEKVALPRFLEAITRSRNFQQDITNSCSFKPLSPTVLWIWVLFSSFFHWILDCRGPRTVACMPPWQWPTWVLPRQRIRSCWKKKCSGGWDLNSPCNDSSRKKKGWILRKRHLLSYSFDPTNSTWIPSP